jgi:8-oxo-dGTP diphosphatase
LLKYAERTFLQNHVHNTHYYLDSHQFFNGCLKDIARMKNEKDILTGAPIMMIEDAVDLVNSYPKVPLTVDCVIFGFEENKLKVLLIRSDLEVYHGKWSLLGDVVQSTEELDEAAYRVLRERTGMTDVYLKQVHAFSALNRHPGGRVVTLAYCSLLNIRHHELQITDNELHWQNVRSLKDMAFDHKDIIDTCYKWLQKSIQEHPLGFNLLPEKFSLRELQNLYEAILNVELDRRNFRKKFFSMDFLIDTGELEEDVKHRPGKLYTFNFEKYEKSKRKWIGIDF